MAKKNTPAQKNANGSTQPAAPRTEKVDVAPLQTPPQVEQVINLLATTNLTPNAAIAQVTGSTANAKVAPKASDKKSASVGRKTMLVLRSIGDTERLFLRSEEATIARLQKARDAGLITYQAQGEKVACQLTAAGKSKVEKFNARLNRAPGDTTRGPRDPKSTIGYRVESTAEHGFDGQPNGYVNLSVKLFNSVQYATYGGEYVELKWRWDGKEWLAVEKVPAWYGFHIELHTYDLRTANKLMATAHKIIDIKRRHLADFPTLSSQHPKSVALMLSLRKAVQVVYDPRQGKSVPVNELPEAGVVTWMALGEGAPAEHVTAATEESAKARLAEVLLKKGEMTNLAKWIMGGQTVQSLTDSSDCPAFETFFNAARLNVAMPENVVVDGSIATVPATDALAAEPTTTA